MCDVKVGRRGLREEGGKLQWGNREVETKGEGSNRNTAYRTITEGNHISIIYHNVSS